MKKYIHFNGRKLFYRDTGEGFPLVLIHGYLETGDVWSRFAAMLAGKFRVIIPDLPGHGSSDIFSTVHTMEFMAESVKAIIDNLQIKKLFISGHSMGGYVTLAFAEKYPEYLAAYSLIHSHPFADTTEVKTKREYEIRLALSGRKYLFYPGNIERMFAPKNLPAFNEDLEYNQKIASRIGRDGIAAVLRGMMARPSRQAVMEREYPPCLWILGAHDNYIPYEQMKGRVVLTGKSELVIMENSGHLCFIEEKEKSAGVLADFFKKMM